MLATSDYLLVILSEAEAEGCQLLLNFLKRLSAQIADFHHFFFMVRLSKPSKAPPIDLAPSVTP